MWRIAADLVAAIHGVWVAFFVLGPVLAWRHPAWRAAHLAVLWGTTVMWRFYCPLTVLEASLRAHYHPGATPSQSFLSRCFAPFGNLDQYSKVLAVGVIVWTVLWTAVYCWLWYRQRRG